MPKCLSLKKQGPIKGQKSITSFFKSQDVATNSQLNSNDNGLSPSLKRKATSPLSSNFKDDKNYSEKTIPERLLKKQKTSVLIKHEEKDKQTKNCNIKTSKAHKLNMSKSCNKNSRHDPSLDKNKQDIPKEESEEDGDFKINNIIQSQKRSEPAVTASHKKNKSPNKENGKLKTPKKYQEHVNNHIVNKAIKNERSPFKCKPEVNNFNHDLNNGDDIDKVVQLSPFKTPEKVIRKLSLTPKKSPVVLTPEVHQSPKVYDLKRHVSPSRNGSTVKVALDFDIVITTTDKSKENGDHNYDNAKMDTSSSLNDKNNDKAVILNDGRDTYNDKMDILGEEKCINNLNNDKNVILNNGDDISNDKNVILNNGDDINNDKNVILNNGNDINNDKNVILSNENDMNNDNNNIFNDEWNLDEFDEDITENLDLTSIQRCEIINAIETSNSVELRLKNSKGDKGTCLVEGIWRDLPLDPGEIISLKATRDVTGKFHIDNQTGILVLRPDHLMSTTSVLSGVFCKRKAILQDRFKGVDGGNNAMIIGIIIHELVQKALVNRILSLDQLRHETDLILKQSLQLLYDAGLSIEEARSTIDIYLRPLAEFMQTYMGERKSEIVKGQWQGRIDRVLDIEENVYCPQLGLKGKIDATLEVTVHDWKGSKSGIVPLELKSGKASMSAEHRGQLLFYVMMLSELQDNFDDQVKPLLLYLKDKVQILEVNGGYPEKRDLIMLRNEMVQYISEQTHHNDIDKLTDIEEASQLLVQRLPDPINHEGACSRCPYLTICSLYQWHTPSPKLPETHPLSKLRPAALSHITSSHIKYVLHWAALIRMEEKTQLVTSALHSIWTEDGELREKRGACVTNLMLKTVTPSGDKYLHEFERNMQDLSQLTITKTNIKGPQEGEFCIVSVKARPWIAAGVITARTHKQLYMMLERDLSARWLPKTVYQVDMYESYATTSQNLTNLGALIDDNERGGRLRRLIIDKTPPEFIEKLPREVGRLGAKLMRNLNIEQQRAVLKCLAAKQYALVQGLPGTGKTQTISVLIQMLVAMKQRVLVTAHTHSAVDTLLTRLPSTLKIMRLGAKGRIAPSLVEKSEQILTDKCETPEQLAEVYDSMEVIGVTCLGATHALLARTNFDVCIVDEATQVLQCTVIRPLLSASKFVLVGDPEQLPPVVKNKAARRLGMEESLFHRLKDSSATCTLRVQYRLNQTLVELANLVAYDGQLKCADDKVRTACVDVDLEKLTTYCNKSNIPWLMKACSPDKENSAIFINMSIKDTSMSNISTSNKGCVNSDEACVVIAIVKALIESGVRPKDIGIIAPYREQVTLLRNSMKNCDADSTEVSTVDQFQGRDKSVILYSCTRSDVRKSGEVKEGEVLSDRRRMAVSVTRAKHKFLVIGHGDALIRYAPLQLLIDNCPHIDLGKEDIDNVKQRYDTFVK